MDRRFEEDLRHAKELSLAEYEAQNDVSQNDIKQIPKTIIYWFKTKHNTIPYMPNKIEGYIIEQTHKLSSNGMILHEYFIRNVKNLPDEIFNEYAYKIEQTINGTFKRLGLLCNKGRRNNPNNVRKDDWTDADWKDINKGISLFGKPNK